MSMVSTRTLVLCFFIGLIHHFPDAKPIHSKVDPEEFLEKFGYLKHHLGNSIHHHGMKSMHKAIKMYQHMMGVKETGELDSDTMNMMEQRRCGVPDMNPEGKDISAPRIRISINGQNVFKQPVNYRTSEYKWTKHRLTWRISRPSYKLSYESQRRAFYEAFKLWSDVSPLEFIETSETPDIDIIFALREHGDGSFNSFDGKGRILAHAYYPEDGHVHFDDAEDWTEYTKYGSNLMIVAAHEIGHALGLGHSNVRGSLMWPTYQGYSPNYKLPYDDRRAIQSLYGGSPTGFEPRTKPKIIPTTKPTAKVTANTCKPCPTSLPTRPPDVPDECHTKFDAVVQGYDHLIYMFRGEWVWRATELKGLDPEFPKHISEVYDFDPPINFGSAVYSPRTYFTYIFKGDKIWKYWGQQLSDTKTVTNPRWPTMLQAAFADSRGTIYIFSGHQFYIFDEDSMDVQKYNTGLIEDKFPGIPYNIEAAVRLQDGYIYFFKGGRYRKYDDTRRRVLDGYPKLTAPAWMGPECGNGSYVPK